MRRWCRIACILVSACGAGEGLARGADGAPVALQAGVDENVVFDRLGALSSAPELARRVVTPLVFRGMRPYLAGVRAHSIDLARERFTVFVPEGEPPAAGYGLLVFVMPYVDAEVPDGWAAPLQRHGMIFVFAVGSGNEDDTVDRRMPLALAAYENIHARFPIDPARVYIGGFSGGSRIALRLALAYPDVFHGAVLNSGADAIGGSAIVIPPGDLFQQFQSGTRLAYLAGQNDDINLLWNARSQESMNEWCVFQWTDQRVSRTGHEFVPGYAFAHALNTVDAPAAVDAQQLAGCRASLEARIAGVAAEAEAALEKGDAVAAEKEMRALDSRFGGLAEAEVSALEARISASRSATAARPAGAAAP